MLGKMEEILRREDRILVPGKWKKFPGSNCVVSVVEMTCFKVLRVNRDVMRAMGSQHPT